MTMPSERTRAVLWAREFLQRLASPYGEDGIKRIPTEVRKEALRILKHYPFPHDLRAADKSDDLRFFT